MDSKKIIIEAGVSQKIIDDVQFLHKTIWGLDELEMTPSHIYIAARHCGGEILCAYHEGKPVGFVFGFPGIDENGNSYFYSHNLGVVKEFRNQGIGFMLKTRLRHNLLEAGYKRVKWTYEPLDSKNAYSYIRKLGAISNTYFENYYGDMRDAINRELPSDRLIMDWRIASVHVQKVVNKEFPKLSLGDIEKDALLNSLKAGGASSPEPLDRDIDIAALLKRGRQRFYLEIPANYHEIKKASFDLALDWRLHVREMMKRCFEQDLYITNVIFEKQRFLYVLEPINQLTMMG
ncbi:MAG: GNAT family N-acetyltransferase [Calditrichia bacterium]